MSEGRLDHSVRNIKYAVLTSFFVSFLPFITRTVFIRVLGRSYLGIDALFLNIINFLEIVNIGIGGAITFSVYKPIAENDVEKCKTLFLLYKKCYYVMGSLIFLFGMCLIPFLNTIVRDMPDIPESIYLIYMIILIGVISGYFFADKQCIIYAHQNSYIVSRFKMIVATIINGLEILFLLATKQYIIYLLLHTFQTLFLNILLSRKAKALYPQYFEGKAKRLEESDKKSIIKNTSAMMMNRMGSLIINCSDNIVISMIVGVDSVGLYSNYLSIKNVINSAASMFTSSLTASIGNLNAELSLKNHKHIAEVFDHVFFLNYIIYAICSICLYTLFEPFIALWIGQEYQMGMSVAAIIVLNFYLLGVQKTAEQFKAACGLYWQDRYRVFVESIINIIISLLLAKELGVLGVLIGTLVSDIVVTFWLEAKIVFDYVLHQKPWLYYIKNIAYFIICALLCYLVKYICDAIFLETSGIIMFICRAVVAGLLSLVGLGVVFFRNVYLRKSLNILMRRIHK